ncbi:MULTISPECIES: guanylate kinase [Moraxella]|uniref:Guanylate kinase n=1 Tax=Moraxella lacunata TaxID=477 RepID=A0A1B8PYN2_MORLA|nr:MULTISPECIES: guanylate kinase [Moraxella]MBE9578626.1 guanylate kinase [Moraxella sp. K1664]MBE9587915.1 guanylate kinase [Moraxella sp. K1630]MBE9589540.1 guanylate kinase [Moraxella sp. K127]MBE9596144.1 guanylate kinase [Moraxella sp. K2450]MDH9218489.1 guanylate kinase [Moraxella lacunata]
MNAPNPTQGTLFIITAASGTGKTSLVKELLATTKNLVVSVSHTTREPRRGEIDGEHYYFTDTDEFIRLVGESEFLEHAEVFGNYYGTSKTAVNDLLGAGMDVILEIDWQGALQVKKLIPQAVMIFILPPSRDALRSRLMNRNQDATKVIETRLAGAVREMQEYVNFDYVVINDDFGVALSEIKAIITAYRLAIDKQTVRHEKLISQLLVS